MSRAVPGLGRGVDVVTRATQVGATTATGVIEGFEHNDLVGKYDEEDAGDMNSFSISTSVVRDGTYSLKLEPGTSGQNQIHADMTQWSDGPEPGDAWRVYFYMDASSTSPQAYSYFNFGVQSGGVATDGGYVARVRSDTDGSFSMRLYVLDSTGSKTLLRATSIPDLPYQTWHYYDLWWHTVTDGSPTTSDDEIGMRTYDGTDGSAVGEHAAADTSWSAQRFGYWQAAGVDNPTYQDTIEYLS